MRTFPRLARTVHGIDLTVDTFDMGVTNDGIPVIKVVAIAGQTTVEMSHTMGPVDGTHEAPGQSHVQDAIDDLRRRCAKAAAHKEILRTQMDSVT